ncbi:hypothetical protein HF325_003147 [Metschnikowia pulcherrima]|uniref:Serine/threonine-protein kinase BUR1 n=1 Tax=Metschnikowia pulcherrima TaxID=27326 RepID=A0A8H7GTA1_9ASCO|nr:hypothetical protein HF325_003147 [Metschnikowia pulcherrima]
MTSPNIDSDTERTVKIQPIDKFESMARLDQFEVIKKIGQGTFGVVQKARDKKLGNLVALKQLINHSAKEGFPITAMREITILKRLNHKNVLKIEGMIHEEPKTATPQDIITQRGVFYTVSPYMSSDLVGLLENPATELDVPTIKCILQQLLEGINYIHQQHYLHRDIKAANILLDPNGVVKIADFGLARVYHGQLPLRGKGPGGGERNYTALVVTRWYRPPELLLGERKYTTAVDMWGVGSFLTSWAHQTEKTGPRRHFSRNKPDLNIGLTCKRTLETRFQPLLGDTGADLLSKLLTLDPKRRYNALDALDHAYFTTDPKPILPEQIRRFEESHEIDKERFKRLRTSTWSTEHVPKRPRAEQERNDRSVALIRDGNGMKPPTGPLAMKPDYF